MLAEHQTVTSPVTVHAAATVHVTDTKYTTQTITEHVRATSTVATEYATETAYVTAAPDYHHKRLFNSVWNDFFQKLYLKDAALTEIKCAAIGYKVPVKTIVVPLTE